MSQPDNDLKLDPYTQKFIEIWYRYLKKRLCFDDVDEFLMDAVRAYTIPYVGRVPPEVVKLFSDLYESKN